jgi:hypothetical protein
MVDFFFFFFFFLNFLFYIEVWQANAKAQEAINHLASFR